MPAFNEADRLTDEAELLHRAVVVGAIDPSSTELIVVDDGSSDDTAVKSGNLFGRSFPAVRILRQDVNSGKGAAIREGVRVACAPLVAFMDADMAVDPQQIPILVKALEHADVAIGSRSVPGSIVDSDNLRRALMGRTFSRFVNALTGLGIVDTQCGFKAFRTPVARLLFHCMVIERFAFDVELLYLARRLRLRVAEVPVHWRDVGGSAVRPVRDPVSMVWDVLRLRIGTKVPPIPALTVTVSSATEARPLDKGMRAALIDAIGDAIPVCSAANDQVLVLFPLAEAAVVRRVASRIEELFPDGIVHNRSMSIDDLINWTPTPFVVRRVPLTTTVGETRASDKQITRSHASHPKGTGTSDQEPLSLPGT